MRSRTALRRLVPPIVLDALRYASGRSTVYAGDYSTWQEALAHSSGYHSADIVNKVAEATRKVVVGGAAYERDSVLFDKIDYSFPVLAGLLRAALESGGFLSVLDFGGALGSSYRQCREFLRSVKDLEWVVVEQEEFVKVGHASFTTPELRFAYDPSSAGTRRPIDVVLLSSVLQYLERPHDVFREIGRTGAAYAIIDRTPFCARSRDHLTVQRVPRHIYSASYPCWVFSRSLFLGQIEADWSVVSDHPCPEGDQTTSRGLEFSFRGFILRRKR